MDKWTQGERYWWLNEESQQVLNRGYLLSGETVEGAINRVTTAAAKKLHRPEWKPFFKEIIEKGWMSLSSPIWANMGTQRGLPIACYGVSVPDSVENITSKLGEVIMQTKIGGGTSGYFGELRGRGSAITDNGKSSGAVSFMQLFDTTMNVVSQGACYQKGTKVLTDKGFKDFREIQHGVDLIAQVDECNNIDFTDNYELTKKHFTGNLVKIRGRKKEDLISVGVTPNHRMVVERMKGSSRSGTKHWANKTEIVLAKDLKLHRDNRLFMAGKTATYSNILSDEERLKIAFQADGRKDYKSNTMQFRFKKTRKIERLRSICKNLNLIFEEKYISKDNSTNFYIYNVKHLKEKTFSWVNIAKISFDWCTQFLDELSNWDSKKNPADSFTYASTVKENVIKVQEIAVLSNKRNRIQEVTNREGNRRDIYYITISNKPQIQGDSCEVYEEFYDDYVYCAVVPKGRLIVSFENRTLVCGNTRRGAFAAYLDIDHPDIKEFLQIKDIGHPIQNLFHAVCVPDYWMQEMIEGDDEKREIWAKVLEARQTKGLPYIFFTDNVNKNKPEVYKKLGLNISHSNLCVSPTTQILTSTGYQLIGDLENQYVDIWNGNEWSNVQIVKTGTNQKLLRVTTDSGYTLDCTPYHKFYIQKGYDGGTGVNKLEILEVRTKDLKVGDKLIKFDLPIVNGNIELGNAYANGFCSVILNDMFFVPDATYSIQSRLDWLAGYLDAKGTVTDNNGSQSLQIACVEKEFLKEVQLMLQTLGCDSKITLIKTEEECYCKEINRLLINGNSMYKLSQLGLKCDKLTWDVKKPNGEDNQFIKIESVEELPNLSDTYCFTEPKRHLGMFNGILTGQCAEIALPDSMDESFVCCLSSMNLELYDEWKDTDAVKYAIYFLDAVLSEFIEKTKGKFYLQAARKFAMRHRAIGLGVMGWHSYLQKNMIPFESLQAKGLTTTIFKQLQDQSKEASEYLAGIYGPAPIFLEGEQFEKVYRNTTTMAIAPTTSSSAILGQVSPGIEPFSSNYYKAGLAKGNFIRKNKYLSKLLEELGLDTEDTWREIMLKGGSVQHIEALTREQKEVFKTFKELSQKEIIIQASIRQKYIDQSQSLNINIPSEIPIKEVNRLILDAWELGVKSLYYQRSQSVAKELLTNIVSCTSCEG